MTGHPLKIVSINENRTYTFNEFGLADILLNKNVRDRNVAIISIAGSMRKGKSFMLNFFLRYLNAKYVKMDATNWLGDPNDSLEGFSWSGGTDRDTSGILIWSEVFLYNSPTGEEIAIILMDTQGVFDNQNTIKDNTAIFALSTLMSSVQIYNVQSDIREDDLQHLQLFIEYGKLALEKTGTVPFQELIFLIRDFGSPYEFPFGSTGGAKFLDKKLKVSNEQADELRNIREYIRSSFETIKCYLLPTPGPEVIENPKFKGKLKDIREKFVEQLQEFIPSVLSPENLVLKTINGQILKAKEIPYYFSTFVKYFNKIELPCPESLFATTAKVKNMQLMMEAVEFYSNLMSSLSEKIDGIKKLDDFHKQYEAQAIDHFNSEVTIGGEKNSQKYRQNLIEKIDKIYISIQNAASKQLSAKGFIDPKKLNIFEIILRETLSLIKFPLVMLSKLFSNSTLNVKHEITSLNQSLYLVKLNFLSGSTNFEMSFNFTNGTITNFALSTKNQKEEEKTSKLERRSSTIE